MGYGGFSFSLSEDSVDEIRSFIDGYIQDMIDLMNGFQDELAAHFSSVHYMKLWKAVTGIIDLYNESVRQELKDEIYTEWEDSGESVTAYVQRMDMGEDSEEAAAEIEDILSELFEWNMDDRLGEVQADGNSGASEADFDEIKNIFAGVVKKAEEATEDMQSAAEERGEDNRVYRLLLPVLRAYGRGICSYFEDAETKLDHLEDDYLDRMATKKDSAREPIKEPDFSVFSDLMYEGMGIAGSTGSKNSGGSPQSLPKEESVDSGIPPTSEKPIDFGTDTNLGKKQSVDSGTDADSENGDYLPEELKNLMDVNIFDDEDPESVREKSVDSKDSEDEYIDMGDVESDRYKNDIKDNEQKSNNHIREIGMRLKQVFVSGKTNKKDILDIISYADIDDLESDLNKFDIGICQRKLEMDNKKQQRLKEIDDKEMGAMVSLVFSQKEKKAECENKYEKELEKYNKKLKKIGMKLKGENIVQCKEKIEEQKAADLKNIDDDYKRHWDSLVRKYNFLRENVLNAYNYNPGNCERLYIDKSKLLSDIQKGQKARENAIESAENIINKIVKNCKPPCEQIVKIYQDIAVRNCKGFHTPVLGHRITINKNSKSWIDSETYDRPEDERLLYDGILNMKTPVHEYLHYLSSDIDGNGVINHAAIHKIANVNDRDKELYVMKGFNEGITEMFAQDFLIEEMKKNYDFENENLELESEIQKGFENIVRRGSYSKQVEIVKRLRGYLGSDREIREAYIKHDISILEKAVDARARSYHKKSNWKAVKAYMASI